MDNSITNHGGLHLRGGTSRKGTASSSKSKGMGKAKAGSSSGKKPTGIKKTTKKVAKKNNKPAPKSESSSDSEIARPRPSSKNKMVIAVRSKPQKKPVKTKKENDIYDPDDLTEQDTSGSEEEPEEDQLPSPTKTAKTNSSEGTEVSIPWSQDSFTGRLSRESPAPIIEVKGAHCGKLCVDGRPCGNTYTYRGGPTGCHWHR